MGGACVLPMRLLWPGRMDNVQPHSLSECFRRFRDVPIPCRICDMKWGRTRWDIWDGEFDLQRSRLETRP